MSRAGVAPGSMHGGINRRPPDPCALRSICPHAGVTYALSRRTIERTPPSFAMESFVIWYFLLSIAAGMIASLGSRSWWAFFALSLLFTPAIGIVLALFAASREPQAQPGIVDRLAAREFRKCPRCAELVRREATKCRFCGGSLNAPAESRSVAIQSEVTSPAVPRAAAAPPPEPRRLRAVAKRGS